MSFKKAFFKLYRDYFNFSKAEKNAFFVLMLIILALMILPYINFKKNETKTDFKDFDLLVNQIKNDTQKAFIENNYDKKWQNNKTIASNFVFNPNIASEDDFIKLGFNKYIAQRILKMRKSGWDFKFKSDLKKVYGIDTQRVNELYAYIDLPEKKNFLNKIKEDNIKPIISKKQVFEINSCDTSDLKQIKGIGSILAKRIIGFRNKLGGFYDKSQFNEIYGLNPETIKELNEFTEINTQNIQKININLAEYKQLIKFPFLDQNKVKAILNYKKQHGDFKSEKDLMKINILEEEDVMILLNYINF